MTDQHPRAVQAVKRIAAIHFEEWDGVLIEQAAQIILEELGLVTTGPVVDFCNGEEAALRAQYHKTLEDDDLDEPLGEACKLDNPDCESCQ